MLQRIGRSALKSHNTKQVAYQLCSSSPIFGVSGSRIFSKHLSTQQSQQSTIYVGPLATVAKRLKLFSISSLGLSSAITPFVFVLDFPVPVFAKVVLVGSALFTSASSTGLINWVMSPYVTKATTSPEQPGMINLHTLNVIAQEHVTIVPITALQPSTRVFTTIMINEGKMSQAQGRIGEKIVRPKQVFYVHPETCQSGPLHDAISGLHDIDTDINTEQKTQ
ncbi:hypothetical protein INT43_001211 [Umbelopsis isabellina]|uniref:Uncharacterized protein n=1 Tax=Mortierella isabellina TaxID=91625 RepID=A0A8H7PLB6_MORIS|nr:hypothetical protein INT43_001211 [Umbelopsis isabellina]